MRTGNYVNEHFSYHLLSHEYDPMDFQAYRENPMRFYAVCTDIDEGHPVYHEIDDADGTGLRWMQASASMPVFARPVEIEGRHYLDGGITDSIPLKFIQQKGYRKNVVILTQPADYYKKKAHVGLAMKMFLKKYPKVVVAEQNMGQLAAFLRMKINGFVPEQYNQVKGQPFVVNELVAAFNDILNK